MSRRGARRSPAPPHSSSSASSRARPRRSSRFAASAAPRSLASSASPTRRPERSERSTSTGTVAAARPASRARRSRCSHGSCASRRRSRSSQQASGSGAAYAHRSRSERDLVRPRARGRARRIRSRRRLLVAARRRMTSRSSCSTFEPPDLVQLVDDDCRRPRRRGVRPRDRRQVAVHRPALGARRRDRHRDRCGARPRRPATLRRLRHAGLLHDIGKLGISNLILDKPGHLTPDERLSIEQHPAYSREFLARVEPFRHLADDAAAHHEKLDGSGYPLGLAGDELSIDGADPRRRRRLRSDDREPSVPRPAPRRGGARRAGALCRRQIRRPLGRRPASSSWQQLSHSA